MRAALSKLVLLCGAVLVALRFYSSHFESITSKLFFDNIVHDKIETLSVRFIGALTMAPGDASQPLAVHFISLAHVTAVVAEALGIALIFYLASRWIKE
jgi:hypothetical protein